MITPFAHVVPLRHCRYAPMTPFHHMGKSFPFKRSDETMNYPKPLANSNCRQPRKLDGFLKSSTVMRASFLDDIGYVQQDREEMEVLFTFLAERYERRSVMITSNLVFSKWDQIFKDPMTTMAAIDRLVHHALILEFTGESVRAQKAQERERK